MSKNNLDQFFTDPVVAITCAEYFKSKTGFKGVVIEPSAGAGAFVDAFENQGYEVEGYDIDPKLSKFKQQDFLTFEETLEGKAIITNPPFGKKFTLAINFFKHAAELNAEYVAFLCFRSFKNFSYLKRLPKNYREIGRKYIDKVKFRDPDGSVRYTTNSVFIIFKREDNYCSSFDDYSDLLKFTDCWEDSDFWFKSASYTNTFIYDLKNLSEKETYIASKYVGSGKKGSAYNLIKPKIINGDLKYGSTCVFGVKIVSEEVSIEDIKFIEERVKYEYSGIGGLLSITPAAIGYVLRGYLENGRKLPDLD